VKERTTVDSVIDSIVGQTNIEEKQRVLSSQQDMTDLFSD